MKSYNFIPFDQPIGSFLLSVIPASDILEISHVDRRSFDLKSLETIGGPQRELSIKRIKEIAKYSRTTDATFPTPILLALSPGDYEIKDNQITITKKNVASVVDGQHRLKGLEKSTLLNAFNLPVVFILDANEEQKALIFAIINGKQTKVPASIIFDLFGIIESRSPQKTCHEIARALNSEPNSPWYRRLKMLGKKTEKDSNETLSQGTFIKFLLPLISDNPELDLDLIKRDKPLPDRKKCIFNHYFIKNQDHIILKILLNLFTPIQELWPNEWDDPSNFILTKTTGFTGIMKALPYLFKKGKKEHTLSMDYFKEIFTKVKVKMKSDNIHFNSVHFPPGAASETKLKNYIIESLNNN